MLPPRFVRVHVLGAGARHRGPYACCHAVPLMHVVHVVHVVRWVQVHVVEAAHVPRMDLLSLSGQQHARMQPRTQLRGCGACAFASCASCLPSWRGLAHA